MASEYYNVRVADWARQNISSPIEIKPIGGSRLGKILILLLCFSVPIFFFALAVLAFALGARDRATLGAPIFFGFLLMIPATVIVLVGLYTRKGFARSLDAEGVIGDKGQRFAWGKLYYVDHVTKHIRTGHVSRRIKDNQLELIFENGKVVVPPLIRDRERIWQFMGQMPTEVRDDGVPRKRPDVEKAFMEFLNQA